MTHFPRLAATFGLALLALAAPALADDGFGLRPPSVTGSYLSGQQALEEMRTDDAARYFREAAAAEWDNPIVVERAFMAYAADGQVDAAATAAQHLLELDPDNEMAHLVVATQALKQRRYQAARTDLDKLGNDSFEGITGALLQAWAYTGEGKLDVGFKLLDKVGQGGLEQFLAFHRAIMADVAGRQPLALRYAAEAYEADPYVARIVEAYARILGNAGEFDKAVDVIVNYEAQGLTHPLIDEVKSAVAKKQRPGLFASSVQAGAAEMFHSVGVALAREGTPEVSLIYLRLALYLDPSADIISLELAQLYDDAGRHETANALYDSVPARSPLRAMATVRIAGNLDATGDRPEAIRRLGNIIATNPDDLDAISVLGDLQRSDKQFGAAAATYTRALALTGGDSPGDWRFYYVRGIAYERNKEWPLAEKDFLRSLDLNPDQPQVLNYLGYSWVDQGTNLSKALDMIQKAVKATPNDGYIIDSLGWAYYRLGRYDDAVVQLEQAVVLRPNDPEINDHLGDAYWRDGRRLEAKFQWNVAASVDKDGDVKARVAPKLAGGLDAAPPSEDAAPVTPPPSSGDQASAQ